jgi:hypothetical protein
LFRKFSRGYFGSQFAASSPSKGKTDSFAGYLRGVPLILYTCSTANQDHSALKCSGTNSHLGIK